MLGNEKDGITATGRVKTLSGFRRGKQKKTFGYCLSNIQKTQAKLSKNYGKEEIVTSFATVLLTRVSQSLVP